MIVVVVPRRGTEPALVIDAGSGVVCADFLGERVLVYFEGNRYGASNLQTFEERVRCAAGRLVQHYPTVARGQFARADFTPVGLLSEAFGLTITDAAAVAAWTSEAE